MSFFDRQTVTVEIDKENRVTIRKLTYGEQQAAMSAAMNFEMALDNGTVPVGKLDPFRIKREELLASVASWDGPGFDGRPVTRENIEALPPTVVDTIQAAIDRLNSGLEAAEKKD